MTDDTELLDQLEKALRPGPVEPPPARVQGIRALVNRHRPMLRAVPGGDERPSGWAAPTPPHPGAVPAPRWGWADRRLTMVFSGVAAAALLVIALVAALQTVPGSSPDRSNALLRAQNAAFKVRVALERKDPAQVAKADADLLRTATTVPGEDADEAQRIAVPVHVQAIAFLRDHASPQVLSDVPGAVPSGGGPAVPAGGPPDAALLPLPSIPGITVPAGVPTSVGPVAVPPVDAPTTTIGSGPVAPTVTITGIKPRLDGNFEVNFTVAGFAPDASGAPGTYAVRFSYDGGADATTYTGDSPWNLPLVKAILHRQVCADVVDANGDVVPGSGTCTNIINL